MLRSCSIIIRKSPGQEEAALGIRAAWAMLTNGSIDINLIFMGDGIYSALIKAGYMRGLLERFLDESSTAYVVQEDLQSRGIDLELLPDGLEVVPAAKVPALIDDADSIMTF